MPWPLTVAAVLAGLFALDRLFRWMERRGWIFYRERKPSGSGVANALGEFQAMLTPAARELVVARAEPRAQDEDDDGDPPDDPASTPGAPGASRARPRRPRTP